MKTTTLARQRINAVDMLRGLVIVVMALDHIRDYSSIYHFDSTDLTQTSPALFMTRWITHFCAPVFMFVAGIGTGLGELNGKSKQQLSHFLWTRGLWLVILEITVVKFAWFFNFSFNGVVLQVIWALGISMICLAALIHLPWKVLLIFSLIMVFGHNLFDSIHPEQFGSFSWLWKMLHVKSDFSIGTFQVLAIYPLIPWISVMALGYCFSRLYRFRELERRRVMYLIGGACIGLFIILRGVNVYGDLNVWSAQKNAIFTALSFLNVTKYPPSLDYLLMTLGPSIILLAWMEKLQGRVGEVLLVYGRVPMFFYILHLYLIHIFCIIIGSWQGYGINEMSQLFRDLPQGFGYGLPVTYGLWLLVLVTLYPLCYWYMGIKKRYRHPVFSYI